MLDRISMLISDQPASSRGILSFKFTVIRILSGAIEACWLKFEQANSEHKNIII